MPFKRRHSATSIDGAARDTQTNRVRVVVHRRSKPTCRAIAIRVRRAEQSFGAVPTEVRCCIREWIKRVDLFTHCAANITNPQHTGCAIETRTEWITHAARENLVFASGTDEWIRRGNVVVLVRIAREIIAIHIDAQHFAEKRCCARDRLRSLRTRSLTRVAAVTEWNVEQSIRSKAQ